MWRFDGTNWTWVGGTKLADQNGVYGTMGVASASNIPGGRSGAVVWKGSSNKVYLFGGQGHFATGTTVDRLSDLWVFNGNWTWISGNSNSVLRGIYEFSSIATPGSRSGAIAFKTSSSVFLFGGYGYDAFNSLGEIP